MNDGRSQVRRGARVRVVGVVAILGVMLAACGDSTSESEPGEVVQHDNPMAFLQAPPPSWQMPPPPQPTLTFQFDYDGEYLVSAGQPWAGVSASGGTPGSPLQVTAKAGRHKTSPPAEWFNQRSGLVLGYGLEDSRPDELYFAFSGTLTINGTSYPIYLGQGADLLGTDWWFGVPAGEPDQSAWTKTDAGYLVTPDGQYLVCPKNGGYYGSRDNAFQVIVPDLAVNCEEA